MTVQFATVSRIPMVTMWFWLVKVMITGADVFWPDSLYGRFGPVFVSGMICLVLAGTLAVQFRARHYRPWVFWPAVVAVSVAGTEAANGPHVKLGLSYLAVALFYLVLLILLIAWWRAREGTVSLRSVNSVTREGLFWAASLAASALGAAIVHLNSAIGLAGLLGLGVWAALISCIGVACWRFGLSPVVAFWSSYVLSRPLGTSIAGQLAGQAGRGGHGLGQWPVTAALAAGAVIVVAYLAVSRRDVLVHGAAVVQVTA